MNGCGGVMVADVISRPDLKVVKALGPSFAPIDRKIVNRLERNSKIDAPNAVPSRAGMVLDSVLNAVKMMPSDSELALRIVQRIAGPPPPSPSSLHVCFRALVTFPFARDAWTVVYPCSPSNAIVPTNLPA